MQRNTKEKHAREKHWRKKTKLKKLKKPSDSQLSADAKRITRMSERKMRTCKDNRLKGNMENSKIRGEEK